MTFRELVAWYRRLEERSHRTGEGFCGVLFDEGWVETLEAKFFSNKEWLALVTQMEEHKGMPKEQISTKVHTDPHPAAEIRVDGMGTSCTPNGSPVYLQFFKDKWELVVWSDINKEGPTHRIDMSGAFESRRKVALCVQESSEGDYLVIKNVPGQVVAQVDPGPRMREYAQLFAAAPKLLEATQNVLDWADGEGTGLDVALIREALSEATQT